MLRASCTVLIKQLCEAGEIDEYKKGECLEFISNENNHEKIRNLIAMILLPKKIHLSDESQAAYLRAAVSRVSDRKLLSGMFQIANPTILENEGALMLEPVYRLLFGRNTANLGLTRDQVKVYYRTYKLNDPDDLQTITDQKLAPGMKNQA